VKERTIKNRKSARASRKRKKSCLHNHAVRLIHEDCVGVFQFQVGGEDRRWRREVNMTRISQVCVLFTCSHSASAATSTRPVNHLQSMTSAMVHLKSGSVFRQP
jgi:hypothetical protein